MNQYPGVPNLRSAFNYNTDLLSDETGLNCQDPSRTVQEPKEETDINEIVRRFGLTGKLPDDLRNPVYGDFLGIADYHGAMMAVAAANEAFDRLPAALRERFGNDPEQYVTFCLDDKNKEEMQKLGLTKPKPPEKTAEITVNKEDKPPKENTK